MTGTERRTVGPSYTTPSLAYQESQGSIYITPGRRVADKSGTGCWTDPGVGPVLQSYTEPAPWGADPSDVIEASDTASILEHLAGKIAGLRPEWWSSAACLGGDLDVFFPRLGATSKPAKLICSGCLVISECREHALAHPDLDGVRGGLSHRERLNMETDRKRRESMR